MGSVIESGGLGGPGETPARETEPDETQPGGLDLARLLSERAGEAHDLQSRMLNPQLPRMLHAIGFDRAYVRAEGAYLYDRDGNDYLDFLSGFGVFAAGRNHPAIRAALHQVLDAQLADLVQFDSPLLAGLLAERLLARASTPRRRAGSRRRRSGCARTARC